MTGDERRPLIDEQGRLFGAVNIIDALVVLFVAAVVVGGIWFVAAAESDPNGDGNGGSGDDVVPTTAIRYATLDLGTESPQVASQIAVDDSVQTAENAALTITDIYRAEANGDIRVFVRVELEGLAIETETGTRFDYAEAPPRIERELTLETDRYETTGRIRSVESEGAVLERIEVETVLDVTLSATALDAMAVGDTYTVGGEPIGTVESIEAYGTGDPETRQAQIGVTYVTIVQPAAIWRELGTTPIRQNATLPFKTESYEISGEIQRIGATEPRGELTTRTATLELTGVSERRAAQFEPGMAERVNDETIAELTDVEVTETDDGDRTVTMTADVRVRETTAGPKFKNRPLRSGETITLEFAETSVDVTVLSR